MSVVFRSNSGVAIENGETFSLLATNLSASKLPFSIFLPVDEGTIPTFVVSKDFQNQESGKIPGWGAGARILISNATCERKPSSQLITVLTLLPNQNHASRPLKATLLEGVVDPVLTYHPPTRIYSVLYWVNAWSPPSTTYSLPSSLFSQVKPPSPQSSWADASYLNNNAYLGKQPPPQNFTAVRDVPDWFQQGTAPPTPIYPDSAPVFYPPGSTTELIGPFDLNRFWVAPFTDGHLYRFPPDFDPIPPPPTAVSDSPVTPTPPDTVDTTSTPDFLGQYFWAVHPQTPTTLQVNNALYSLKQNKPLLRSERLALEEYTYAPRRLAYLSRCTRVLMFAKGYLVCGNEAPESDRLETATTAPISPIKSTSTVAYLILDHPTPILALPRGINKVVVQRSKWISYLTDGRIFITASLNYRYPAAATVSLVAGNPQVDFLIHDPSDHFDFLSRAGIFPESQTPQRAPFDPGASISILGGLDTSLVGLMNQTSLW